MFKRSLVGWIVCLVVSCLSAYGTYLHSEYVWSLHRIAEERQPLISAYKSGKPLDDALVAKSEQATSHLHSYYSYRMKGEWYLLLASLIGGTLSVAAIIACVFHYAVNRRVKAVLKSLPHPPLAPTESNRLNA